MADEIFSKDAEIESSDEPPAHLSEEAQREWRQLTAAYELDDPAAVLIMTRAFEAFDRMRGAQAVLTRDGIGFRDRFGKPKVHPMVAVEMRERSAFLDALARLNLDLEPLRDSPGRPPGSPMDAELGPRRPRRPASNLFDN